MKVRLRSSSIALTVVILAGLIGWVSQTSWRQLHQLRRNFATVQNDGLHLSERVETSVRILNEILIGSPTHSPSETQALFKKEGRELQQSIAAHKLSATSPLQRRLIERIGTAVDIYLAGSATALEEKESRGAESASKLLLEQLSDNAKPLLTLCRELSAVEHAALDQFVRDSYRAVGWLQRLLLISLVLLVSFTATMVLSLYRGTITPLRAKLVQSRAIIERDEKLAALGTMAAGMAHEIRNPLTAVNVRLHSLTRTLLQGSSEQEDALVIGSELQRLDRMLRQFLQFARPAEPHMVTVSADYLLRRIHTILAPHLAKDSIQFKVESMPNSWIHVDPDQMEQVLLNLVKNAAESIGRDGEIILRARNEPARLVGRVKPRVILEVSDTGPGIPPEVQPRLFDPFFTTKESGTGLGLPIAARIVEQHGGTLIYKTVANQGSTFSVVLPLAEKHEDECSSSHSPG